jgi:hypothetical protein
LATSSLRPLGRAGGTGRSHSALATSPLRQVWPSRSADANVSQELGRFHLQGHCVLLPSVIAANRMAQGMMGVAARCCVVLQVLRASGIAAAKRVPTGQVTVCAAH